MKRFILPLVITAFLTGCAITTEGSLTAPLAEKPGTICIINNPDVGIGQVNSIIQRSLKARGVSSVVCETAKECKYPWHMTYTMTRRWDMVPYLASGYMELYKNGESVSSVDFSGGWGLNLAKWGHTKEKIDGMVGALLGERAN